MAENIDCSTTCYSNTDGETYQCLNCNSICSSEFQDANCKKRCPFFIPPSVPEAGVSTSSDIVGQTTSYADVEQTTSYCAGVVAATCNCKASVIASIVLAIVLFIVLVIVLKYNWGKLRILCTTVARKEDTQQRVEEENQEQANNLQETTEGPCVYKDIRRGLQQPETVEQAFRVIVFKK